MNRAPIHAAPRSQRAPDFVDTFDRDIEAGAVIGSTTATGVVRRGVDAEGVIGVDHGALRIRPMVEQGWGRSLVSYGPYERRDGLMFAAMVLNGHNTSQSEVLPEPLASRLLRWLQGHGDRRMGLVRRLGQWLRHRRKSYLIHKIRAWRRMASGNIETFDENLAIGWFPLDQPGHPNQGGNVFVMHAALGDNGELWVRSGGELLPVTAGIQNVPMCYVTILRDVGAAYYLASVPSANGAGTFPEFRPYSIDARSAEPEVYAGVHQAALGQIGFRVDTRVYATQVAYVEPLAQWFGTAHAADTLTGSGVLDGVADVGGPWSAVTGAFERGADGVRALSYRNLAVLRPDRPSGLVHMLAIAPDVGTIGLVWRYHDADNHCRVEVDHDGVIRLVSIRDGVSTELAATTTDLARGTTCSIQVIDDGTAVRCAVDGRLAFPSSTAIDGDPAGHGVGLWSIGTSAARLSRFEAHPMHVDLGGVVDLPAPWFALGGDIVVHDEFDGEPSSDLAGRTTTVGDVTWRREYGHGRMSLTHARSVAVDASIDHPNPGNTAYLVEWTRDDFVDVAVDITPPGSAFGEGHRGRGGLVVWDDRDNYLMISMYVDDSYDGASIAIFSHLDGFEDIYDAVWSMVGKKIYWGATHRLRVVCDGTNLMVFIDDEPVLYRAVTDLYSDRGAIRINGVGLAVNWEWGDDTGTVFANFAARSAKGQS